MCRKYQRHCGAYLALQEAATKEWTRAETLEDVCRAWGRFGGLVTLHRYGPEHMTELARHRWSRTPAKATNQERPAHV